MKKIIIINSIIVFIICELTCRIVPFIKNYTLFSSTGYGVDPTGRINLLTLKEFEKLAKEKNKTENNTEFSYKFPTMNQLRLYGNFYKNPTLLCLGDSYTQGIGAPPDSSYPVLIEKISNTAVLNAGLSGSNPVYEKNLLFFLINKEKIKPKIVSIAINMSDIADLETNLFLKNKKESFLLKNSIFVRFAYRLIKSGDWKILIGRRNYHENTIDLIYQIITDMNHLCKTNNIKLMVIFHPTQHELKNNRWYFSDLAKNLQKENLQKENIQVVDMLEYFIKKGYQHKSDEIFWPKDGHNNAQGYQLIASAISEKL